MTDRSALEGQAPNDEDGGLTMADTGKVKHGPAHTRWLEAPSGPGGSAQVSRHDSLPTLGPCGSVAPRPRLISQDASSSARITRCLPQPPDHLPIELGDRNRFAVEKRGTDFERRRETEGAIEAWPIRRRSRY
jgi:hypothetical protein